MAIEFLVGGVFGLLKAIFDGVFGALGTVAGGSSVPHGILVGYSWLNTFLPMSDVVAGIGVLLGLYGFLFGYRFVREMWSLIPIIGGHS